MNTAHRLDRLLRLLDEPWAITESMRDTITGVIARRLEGQILSVEEIAAVSQAPRPVKNQGSVAVIPIFGFIANRMNMMTDMSGGTSVEQLRGQIRHADRDESISAIAFDVDSPGGTVAGIVDLAEEIRGLATPTVAVINDLGASAAYWLASAADEIVAAQDSMIGSIGIVASHTEESEAAAKAGIRTTLVSAGEGKTDGSPFEPLSDRARADMQEKVDHFQAMFVASVVKGRNGAGQHIQASTVNTKWKADIYTAEAALRIGMIDRIGTMEETLGRMSGSGRRSGTRADVVPPGMTSAEADMIDGRSLPNLVDEARLRKARRLAVGVS